MNIFKIVAVSLLLYATCPASTHAHKKKPKTTKPFHVAKTSALPTDLSCLKLNCPSELTGYEFYQNVTFDPQLAINPKNPKNMVLVMQQDVLTNAAYNGSATLSVATFYTLDGGITWNQSDLVMSRCQGATNYKANDNFMSAYFPSVTFDKEGNCYVLSSSYNLFSADHQPDVNVSEGNIVAKSCDGGISWDQVSAAFRDDGSCHFLDFPQIYGDPYRKNTVYIVSSDHTCLVSDSCQDPNYTGNQNIFFQKTTDGGTTWTDPILIDSFPPENPDTCTPRPILNQIITLPDCDHTLVVTTVIQSHVPGDLVPTPLDTIYLWRSKDGGNTWKRYTVAEKIPHVMAVDPDSSDPFLPVTGLIIKDIAVNKSNGHLYIVYADPRFNSNGVAGCVVRLSKDGGKTWSRPQPINPKTLDVQTFLPSVAVADDGTVAILFYDFRHNLQTDPKWNTDVWMSFFDKELSHYYGEVRLTKESFDTNLAIRGYNGVDPANCLFDYYLSSNIGLEPNGNNFEATFVVTNDNCPVTGIAQFPCDSFPLSRDGCNRQDVVYVHINRT